MPIATAVTVARFGFLEQFSIYVRVGRMTDTKNSQWQVTGIGHAVLCARWDDNRVASGDIELGLAQSHRSRPFGDVIDLFGECVKCESVVLPGSTVASAKLIAPGP